MKNRRTGWLVATIVVLLCLWLMRGKQEHPEELISSSMIVQKRLRKEAAKTKASAVQALPERAVEAPSFKALPGLSLEQINNQRSKLKMILFNFYAAQRSFFSEHNRYTTDLVMAGNSFEHPLAYKAGFLNAYDPEKLLKNEDPGLMNSDVYRNANVEAIAESERYLPSADDINIDDLQQYCQQGCTATEDRFEVISGMNLDQDATLDVWILNEKKKLVHVVDDLKN